MGFRAGQNEIVAKDIKGIKLSREIIIALVLLMTQASDGLL
jgi:hypothetical protein